MPTLLTIPFSHFCEKARWALDHARVTYREEGHVPGLHRRAVRRVRGKGGSVPVLVVEGEGVLDDSPLIVRWADGRAPRERKLLPTDVTAREEALALERQLDVDLGPHVRRFGYFHLLPQRRQVLALMAVDTPRLEHAAVRLAFPALRWLMRRTMRIDASRSAASREKVLRVFDAMSERLADGRPYLLGDRFGAVDITFAALAAPLLAPPEHPVRPPSPEQIAPALAAEVQALRGTPAGRFGLRLYREHRRAHP